MSHGPPVGFPAKPGNYTVSALVLRRAATTTQHRNLILENVADMIWCDSDGLIDFVAIKKQISDEDS
jgi:hypothetical protein